MIKSVKPEGVEQIAAIILSAGFSQRMGTFKPLLGLGASPALKRCLDLFRSVGIENLLVVSGHKQKEIASIVADSNAAQVINPRYQEGMFSSIVAGIDALGDSCDAFFMLPVDIPLVRPATVRQLLLKFRQYRTLVCYPHFDGRRGHPPLISSRLIPDIVQWQGSGGLAGFLRRMENRALDVAVADQAVLLDMDTPGDYQKLQKVVEDYGFPSEKECQALLQEVYPAANNIRAHCKMVARVAKGLGQVIAKAGIAVKLRLLHSSGAVHDLARGQRHHAQVGAQILNWWGFGTAAPLVAAHMDLELAPEDPLDEKQILYLADKLVLEDRLVDLDERFQMKLDHYTNNQAAAVRIRIRWQTAKSIQKRIESVTGLPLEKILISLF